MHNKTKTYKKILICIFITTFLQVSCTKNSSKVSEITKPNILFILADDLGYHDLSCMGSNFYETPNIDKLAENGIRFTQAYASHPVCSPTRAALMTGKHPNRVNITDWIPGENPQNRQLLAPRINNELALEEITIAEKLKEKGYATYFVGKWHLGHDEQFWPEFQGFDVNIGGWEAGQPRIIRNVSNGYYSPYGNPRLKDGPEGEYLTDRLTDESIRLISENKNKPFFLYLSYYTVHTPIQPAKKHIDKFIQKREQLNIGEIPHQREGAGWTKLIQENAGYASMVAAMDENVGRVLNSLKENGLDKNTWVFFTSDNGGRSTLMRQNAETSNYPLRAGKGWCYEGGIRVPLVVQGPQVSNPGRIEETPAISTDFFSTILSIAGIEHQNNDGENLLPLLTGKGTVERDALFWHYPHYHGSAWTPGSAIRKGDWKLVTFYEDNRTELFDLKEDPGETKDVAAELPQKTEELKQKLIRLLHESNARFPENNPNFVQK